MTTPPLAPDSDTERLMAEAASYKIGLTQAGYVQAGLVIDRLAAKVRELQAERDALSSSLRTIRADCFGVMNLAKIEAMVQAGEFAAAVARTVQEADAALSAHQPAKEA